MLDFFDEHYFCFFYLLGQMLVYLLAYYFYFQLSIDELPSHSHAAGSAIGINPQPGSGVNGRDTNTSGPVTSSVGGGSAHTHPFTGSPSPWSASIDMNVQYIDVIVCRFN